MYVIRDDAGSHRLSSKYSSDRCPLILSDAASQPERCEELQIRTNLAKRCSDGSGSKERRQPCHLGEMLRGSLNEQRMNPAQHPLLVTSWNCLLEQLEWVLKRLVCLLIFVSWSKRLLWFCTFSCWMFPLPDSSWRREQEVRYTHVTVPSGYTRAGCGSHIF